MMHTSIPMTIGLLFSIIMASALIPTIIVLGLWIAENEKAPKEPTDEQVDAACRGIYSNFDTLSNQVKETTRGAARAWLKAWDRASKETELR